MTADDSNRPKRSSAVSPERSANMRAVRSFDTKPEMIVRRLLHRNGLRFRLHRGDLPGRPDIVLPKHRLAIFVHGCFWHRHSGCRRATHPKTRTDFWADKFEKNVRRDSEAERKLVSSGWKVVVVWECETKNPEQVMARILDTAGRPDQASADG